MAAWRRRHEAGHSRHARPYTAFNVENQSAAPAASVQTFPRPYTT